jgi:hypothetical protein
VVDCVVYGLDDLPLPSFALLQLVEHVVDVDRPVEELGTHPLEKERVRILREQNI